MSPLKRCHGFREKNKRQDGNEREGEGRREERGERRGREGIEQEYLSSVRLMFPLN